jgi:hypothetical protein
VAPVQREHRPSDLAIHEGRVDNSIGSKRAGPAGVSYSACDAAFRLVVVVHKCLDTAKLELNNDMEHQRLDLAENSGSHDSALHGRCGGSAQISSPSRPR